MLEAALKGEVNSDLFTDDAKKQQGIAEAETARTKEAELLARRRFYAAQMNLAMQAWEVDLMRRSAAER